jgi:hypothetical protein
MGARGDKSVGAVGFVAVCDFGGRGLVGGYLLLNAAGRPLEFHCTAPVRPSRAQEILYGPTLLPFLYGEQIGRALLEKASTKPVAVFVDAEALLAAQPFVDAPLAVVCAEDGGELASGAAASAEMATASRRLLGPPRFCCFRLNNGTIALPASRQADEAAVAERLSSLGATFDLAEPFERIREAVAEAHRDATSRSAHVAGGAATESEAKAA